MHADPAPVRSPVLTVDPDRLGDEIAEIASQIDAATHRLLTCIRRFDETRAWSVQGARDCAHWLSWRIGLGMGTAREKVRVARALGRLPLVDDEFRKGALSYAKVRAITRIATPEIEAALVHMGRAATGADLERICRGYRSVEPAKTPDPDDERRSVRKHVLEDGRVRLEIVLEADEAALVLKAIDGAMTALRADTDVSAETRPSRADGLRLVAETFLEKGPAAATSGDRAQVMVHLEQDVLGPDGRLGATLEDGTHVPAETLRRLACDSGLVVALMDASRNPLDVGRKTRSIPPAIRRALAMRDRTCRFPGCRRQACLHGHHIESWLAGGETKLSNLVLLCPFHHWLVHEGGFRVATVRDGLEFRREDGSVIPRCGPPIESPNGLDDVRRSNAAAGVAIDAMTSYLEGDGRGRIADAVGALCDLTSMGA